MPWRTLKIMRREEILAACFPDGAAQQGLPTSPALANLAGIAIDEAIRRKIKKASWRAAYTRYADDLSLSFPAVPECGTETVIAAVDEIVRRCGHQLNARKTRIQKAGAGRWECCGVMVDDKGVHIHRRQRRLLRALTHNAQKPGVDKKTCQRAAGLSEWAKLRKPVTAEEKRERKRPSPEGKY